MFGVYRKLRIETLESRQMMAVEITRSGDTLEIRETEGGAEDYVEIFSLEEQRFRVLANVDGDRQLETRNSRNITKISIELGGAEDTVYVHDIQGADGLETLDIDMRGGSDLVYLDRVRLDNLNIDSGIQFDEVYMSLVSVDEETNILTGDSSDRIFLGFRPTYREGFGPGVSETFFTSSTFGFAPGRGSQFNSFRLDTDVGAETVRIRDARFSGQVEMLLGGSNDSLEIDGTVFLDERVLIDGAISGPDDRIAGGNNTLRDDDDEEFEIRNFESDTFELEFQRRG